MNFKKKVIDSVVQGLIEGGFSKDKAYLFELLFERVYESGYNEAMRNLMVNEEGSKYAISG